MGRRTLQRELYPLKYFHDISLVFLLFDGDMATNDKSGITTSPVMAACVTIGGLVT
jgi:hypothetical protein